MQTVAPNPMVGAVLVYNNRILGEGFHQKFGDAHAEVNCINSVREAERHLIQQGTLYVSLEPCAHFGKTPPCAEMIIAHGIKKVVIGCQDIFSEVNGAGIAKLREQGIEVVTDILKKEALQLNKRFFTFHQMKRPYVILKWAQTNNHKIAGTFGARVKITNAFSNQMVHKWRSEEAAIMVGRNTALLDDPQLTTRLWEGKNPTRVIVDRQLALPVELNVFDVAAPTIVYNVLRQQTKENITYHKLQDNDRLLQQVLNDLYNRGINSVMVEGGALLLNAFIGTDLWDEARVFTNTSMQIDGVAAPDGLQMNPTKNVQLHNDILQYYFNAKKFSPSY